MALNPDAEALERGILEHPHDFVRWAVYSDYLTEQGDPRGEFMRVQLDLEDETLSAEDRQTLKRREAEILAEHERTWLGSLAEFTLDAVPEMTYLGRTQEAAKRPPIVHRFERGWLASLDFARLVADHVLAYADCPSARLVREIAINHDWEEFGSGLGDSPHIGAVRALRIGPWDEVTDEGGRHFNSETGSEALLPLVRKMPFLERVDVYARDIPMNDLFALPLPHLRALTLFHPNDTFPLERLAANETMTNLATLRCHPHHLEYGVRVAYIGLDQLRAICRSPHLTSLSHLCLRLTDFGDDGARELVASGILKRLRVLDLFGGCMSDEGAKLLAACPDFKNLEFANLRMNAFTAEGITALEATGVKLDLRQQHTSTSADPITGEPPEYLYEGDFE